MTTKGTVTCVALLRGINVGGKNKMAMSDLAAIFRDAGCENVRTFIQSGNVLFTAPAKSIETLPRIVAAQIEKKYGLRVPVVLRTAVELEHIARDNPFLGGADPDTLHVVFLATAPAGAVLATLDPKRSPPDEFAVNGREIYLRCPKGYGGSKLTNAWFDSKLSTISTVRNWRTVMKLVELAKD